MTEINNGNNHELIVIYNCLETNWCVKSKVCF